MESTPPTDETVEPAESGGPVAPSEHLVRLDTQQVTDLRTLLSWVADFDSMGFGHQARHLTHALDTALDTTLDGSGSTSGPTSREFTYSVLGPWGSHAADSEPDAVAQVRGARLAHWGEGWGRDRRYFETRAVRRQRVDFADGATFVGPDEPIEVPDAPLSATEEAENQRRLAASERDRESLYGYLRDLTGHGGHAAGTS